MTLAKYELIDAEKACHAIARMCAWLGVSRSGYYEWRDRPASATAQRRTLLAQLAAEIYDNAMAESFFSALKNEWLHRFVFATRAKAKRQVIRYIEGFYNRRRLHSALGYRSPLEVLNESLTTQTAA